MKSLWFFVLLPLQLPGQPLHLDMNVFAQRRADFMKQLSLQSVAIFPSKPEYIRNGDVEYEYRQESNFYYLTGCEEPESILLLNPSAPRYKYILCVRARSTILEQYEGPRTGVDGAMRELRADTSVLTTDFAKSLASFIPPSGTLYYSFGTNPRTDERIRGMFLENASGSWAIQDPSPILAEMRLIKNEGDWRMGFQRAIDISTQAHIEAIKAVKPDMYEYEVQAVFEYTYRKNGSPRNAYPCIVGSGPNSCTIHYEKNNRRMQHGEVVLMDCGAEYGYYSADITRTVPVNGRFTKEQREIYRLVLDAQNAAIAMVKPGVIRSAPDSAMKEIIAQGLLTLGFIKEKKDAGIFTLHGFSHWVGLDVHDVGKTAVNGQPRPLLAGMVFTIEPGIYIRPDVFEKMKGLNYTDQEVAERRVKLKPYMNIGVRIEDDVAVTETGCRNLTEAVPRDIDDIENLMKR